LGRFFGRAGDGFTDDGDAVKIQHLLGFRFRESRPAFFFCLGEQFFYFHTSLLFAVSIMAFILSFILMMSNAKLAQAESSADPAKNR